MHDCVLTDHKDTQVSMQPADTYNISYQSSIALTHAIPYTYTNSNTYNSTVQL